MDTLDPPMLSTAMLSFAALKYDPGIPLANHMYTNIATNLPLFEARDLATTAQVRAPLSAAYTARLCVSKFPRADVLWRTLST